MIKIYSKDLIEIGNKIIVSKKGFDNMRYLINLQEEMIRRLQKKLEEKQ